MEGQRISGLSCLEAQVYSRVAGREIAAAGACLPCLEATTGADSDPHSGAVARDWYAPPA